MGMDQLGLRCPQHGASAPRPRHAWVRAPDIDMRRVPPLPTRTFAKAPNVSADTALFQSRQRARPVATEEALAASLCRKVSLPASTQVGTVADGDGDSNPS